MAQNKKGEIWIGLRGFPYAMRAQDIHEKGGKVVFIRLVEAKDGSKRTERITTSKEHVIYTAETL